MLDNNYVYRIGDKLKSPEQYPDFHRGTSYTITGIYHKNYYPVIVVKNKYGKETYLTTNFDALNSFWDKNQAIREREMSIRSFWYLGGVLKIDYRNNNDIHSYKIEIGRCYVTSLKGEYLLSVEKIKNR